MPRGDLASRNLKSISDSGARHHPGTMRRRSDVQGLGPSKPEEVKAVKVDPVEGLKRAKAETNAQQISFDKVAEAAETDKRKEDERREPVSSPPKNVGELQMGRGVDRIVRSIFDLPDIPTEHEEIRKSLRFDGRASDLSHGELVNALNEADELAQRAAELLANVKSVHDVFEIHAKAVESTLRMRGHEALIELKDRGKYSGRFGAEDVEAMMAKLHADEFVDLEKRKGEAKRTVDVVASLFERCVDRARHLSNMVARSRTDG